MLCAALHSEASVLVCSVFDHDFVFSFTSSLFGNELTGVFICTLLYAIRNAGKF